MKLCHEIVAHYQWMSISTAGPSGLQPRSRKRLCPTCEAGPTPSSSHFSKRLRLSPTTSESSGGSEDLVQPLRDRSPPPGPGTFCSLPTTSRYSPPHISHNPGLSSLPVSVNIHSNNPILTPGVGMSGMGMSGMYGPSTSRMPASSGFLYNAPYTTAQYGSIPNTAQQVSIELNFMITNFQKCIYLLMNNKSIVLQDHSEP